jgi:opacity protein-like surface antigen
MNRFSAVAVIAILSISFLPGVSYAGFGIRLTGPATYVGYGDFNDYVDTYNSEYLSDSPYKYENINWAPEFGVEVLYTLLPKIDIGVGAGIIMGTSEYSVSAGLENITLRHKIRPYPFTATAYYRLPWMGGPFKPIAYGGVGVYYNKAFFSSAYMGTGNDYSYEWTLTKWGFGLHGGVGFEISILPKLSVDLGIKARWANFTGFEGTDPISGEKVIIGTGTVEVEVGDPPAIYIVPVYEPMTAEFVNENENLREAEVSLTGYSIVIGINIMF